MNDDEVAERRVVQLRRHLASAPHISESASQLEAAPCAVNRTLPRFDATFMEHYLETDRGLKEEVYDLFKQHPELLYAVEEGMTKGRRAHASSFISYLSGDLTHHLLVSRAASRVCAQATARNLG